MCIRDRVTLTHHDWIAGVDYDAINEPTDTDVVDTLQTNENRLQNEPQTDEIFENDLIDDNMEHNNVNPDHGSLVENVEEPEETEMDQVIDEIIDELNNEVIPAGEELLNEIADT